MEYAKPAQPTGCSTPREFAFQFPICARHPIAKETAFHAMLDTISPMDPASTLLPTTLSPLMVDAPFGIGLMHSAYNAQQTGFSASIQFAFPSTINAEPVIKLVLVLAVIRATIF
jgi:hypothetical protein